MTYLEDYFSRIYDGRITACEKLKKQSEIILNDLYNPGEFHFDEDIANKHVGFIERFCKTPSGKIGTPLRLELFQKARFQVIFGFVDDNNLRQYNEVLTVEGRKNGKTTECASVELDLLCNDKEGAPQIYNVATQFQQASLGFNAAHKMVLQSAQLKAHIKKRANDLYNPYNMGYIKALAANTSSLDGLDVHGAIIDELAAITNRDLYDLIKQATGARSQPLLFTISTNGYVRNSIFDSQYEYATNVINGEIKNKRFLPLIYELDSTREWTNEDCWIKANPGLGTIKSWDYMRQMVQKAKDDPSFEPTVKVKDFNLPQTSSATWLTWEQLDNTATFDIDDVRNTYAIGGCDLSATTDLTCATLLIRKPDDPVIYVLQHYFLPEARIEALETTSSKEAPYRKWEERGLMTFCKGNMVNYSDVTEWFKEMRDKYDITMWRCGYDRALAGYWQEEMKAEFGDSTMEKVAQGPFTWTAPMKELGAKLTDKEINYNNNPVLKWCLSNTGVKAAGTVESIQPVKIQSNMRIDGTVSLLNAYVIYVKYRDDFLNLVG